MLSTPSVSSSDDHSLLNDAWIEATLCTILCCFSPAEKCHLRSHQKTVFQSSHNLLTSARAPLMKGPPSDSSLSRRSNSLPPRIFHHVTQTAALATSISPLIKTSQNRSLHSWRRSCCSITPVASAIKGNHSSNRSIGKTGNESISASRRTACCESCGPLTLVAPFGSGGRGSVGAPLPRSWTSSRIVLERRGCCSDM